jgi:hypothetical protein
MSRVLLIDPDGSAQNYLGVVVCHPTGIIYQQQCGGVETVMRSTEGYFVPVGGVTFDPDQGLVESEALTTPFHDDRRCMYGGATVRLPADRLAVLRGLVSSIPFWTFRRDGEVEQRGHLYLDDTKLNELVEAWLPVVTPVGVGFLTWPNCD